LAKLIIFFLAPVAMDSFRSSISIRCFTFAG